MNYQSPRFPDDIVVGMIPHGREMVLAPALDFEHDYKDDDQIILLSRRFSMKADDNFDPVEEVQKFCNLLAGSFSAVSKRNFARKYAFDSQE